MKLGGLQTNLINYNYIYLFKKIKIWGVNLGVNKGLNYVLNKTVPVEVLGFFVCFFLFFILDFNEMKTLIHMF